MRFPQTRSVSLTVVLLIMLPLIAACGGTGTANTAPAASSVASSPASASGQTAGGTTTACDIPQQPQAVTVNVLAYNSAAIDPFSNAMVKNCSKNGVTVQHAPIDFSGQYQKTSATLAGSQGTYDIIEMYSGAVPRYGSADKLVALDALFAKYKDKYQLGDLNKTMLDGLSFNGKLYGLPTQANVTTLVYRKDIFDKLGLQPPKTYADLLSVATKIQQSGTMQYPIALPFADSTSTLYEQVMASQGKSYVDPATKQPTFASPEAARGLKALADLAPFMDPQVISLNQPKVQQQLYNGKAAVAMMFSGRMTDLTKPDNTSFADKFAFAPPPSIDPGGKVGSTLSVDGWSIPKNSKIDPDLLFQIMAASVSPATSAQAVPAAYPARQGIATPTNVPYAAAVQTSLSNGAAPPPLEKWLGTMQSNTSAQIQAAVSGKTSVSAALAECQKAAIAALQGS